MKQILTILAMAACILTQAQNVAINNDASLPNASAILHIKSSTKGKGSYKCVDYARLVPLLIKRIK